MFHKKESKQEGKKKMEVKENKKEKKNFNFFSFMLFGIIQRKEVKITFCCLVLQLKVDEKKRIIYVIIILTLISFAFNNFH